MSFGWSFGRERRPPYVAAADRKRWTLVGAEPLRRKLKSAGFKLERSQDRMIATWREETISGAAPAKALRELGFAFSAGPGWSPIEIVQHLRDQRLVSGQFTEIYWTGPGKWGLRTV